MRKRASIEQSSYLKGNPFRNSRMSLELSEERHELQNAAIEFARSQLNDESDPARTATKSPSMPICGPVGLFASVSTLDSRYSRRCEAGKVHSGDGRSSRRRALLAPYERGDGGDAVKILHPGLVSLHVDAIMLLHKINQAQSRHGIQNSAGAQRRIVPKIGRIFSGQELGKDVLPQLFSYIVHITQVLRAACNSEYGQSFRWMS